MEKLLLFQNKIGSIYKSQINPYFKSKYFDINTLLEHIKPLLNEVGLLIIQPIDIFESQLILKTLVIDAEKNVTLIESKMILPMNPDPQKMGSLITYFRRYSLQSLLLLEADDDDGNQASLEHKTVKEQTKITTKQTENLDTLQIEINKLNAINDLEELEIFEKNINENMNKNLKLQLVKKIDNRKKEIEIFNYQTEIELYNNVNQFNNLIKELVQKEDFYKKMLWSDIQRRTKELNYTYNIELKCFENLSDKLPFED